MEREGRISPSSLSLGCSLEGSWGWAQGLSLGAKDEGKSLQKWTQSYFKRYQRERLVLGKSLLILQFITWEWCGSFGTQMWQRTLAFPESSLLISTHEELGQLCMARESSFPRTVALCITDNTSYKSRQAVKSDKNCKVQLARELLSCMCGVF